MERGWKPPARPEEPRVPSSSSTSPEPRKLSRLPCPRFAGLSGTRFPALTCPGSAPARGRRPAAPAGSGRPAGRPAPCPRVPAVPPAAPQSLRPSPPPLLSSAAALYPGSRSPLPAGSRTPRLKGTSSFCLGTPSPSQRRGHSCPLPSPGPESGERSQSPARPRPCPLRLPPGLPRTSSHCSGLQTPREGRYSRPRSCLHPGRHPAGCSTPSPGGPQRPAKPPHWLRRCPPRPEGRLPSCRGALRPLLTPPFS